MCKVIVIFAARELTRDIAAEGDLVNVGAHAVSPKRAALPASDVIEEAALEDIKPAGFNGGDCAAVAVGILAEVCSVRKREALEYNFPRFDVEDLEAALRPGLKAARLCVILAA